MHEIYDPFEFISKIELLTIAMLGSFITFKLLNSIYDNMYEPTIDMIVNSEKTDKYYVKIGKYYVQPAMIFKEFIKWIIFIIFLMLVYNILVKKRVIKKSN